MNNYPKTIRQELKDDVFNADQIVVVSFYTTNHDSTFSVDDKNKTVKQA